jgi:hypothetical protein
MLLLATLTYLARLMLGLAQPGYAIVARDFGSLLAAIISIVAGMMLVVGAKPAIARTTGMLGAGTLFLFDAMNLTGGFVDDVIGKYGRWAAAPTVVTAFLAIVALYWGYWSAARQRARSRPPRRKDESEPGPVEDIGRPAATAAPESPGVIAAPEHEDESQEIPPWRSVSGAPEPVSERLSETSYERPAEQSVPAQPLPPEPDSHGSVSPAPQPSQPEPFVRQRPSSWLADRDFDERPVIPQSRQPDPVGISLPPTPEPFRPLPQRARWEDAIQDSGPQPFGPTGQRRADAELEGGIAPPWQSAQYDEPTAPWQSAPPVAQPAAPERLAAYPEPEPVAPPQPPSDTAAPSWLSEQSIPPHPQPGYDETEAATEGFAASPAWKTGPFAAFVPDSYVPGQTSAHPEAELPAGQAFSLPSRQPRPETSDPAHPGSQWDDTALPPQPAEYHADEPYAPPYHAETDGLPAIVPADPPTTVLPRAGTAGEPVPPRSPAPDPQQPAGLITSYESPGAETAPVDGVIAQQPFGAAEVDQPGHVIAGPPYESPETRPLRSTASQPLGPPQPAPAYRDGESPSYGPQSGNTPPWEPFGSPPTDIHRPAGDSEPHRIPPAQPVSSRPDDPSPYAPVDLESQQAAPAPSMPPADERSPYAPADTQTLYTNPPVRQSLASHATEVYRPVTDPGLRYADPAPMPGGQSPYAGPAQPITPRQDERPPYPAESVAAEPPAPQSFQSHATEVYRSVNGRAPQQAGPPPSMPHPDERSPYASAPDSEPLPSNPPAWQQFGSPAYTVHHPINGQAPQPGHPDAPLESPGTAPIPAQQRIRQPVLRQPGGFLAPPPVDSDPMPAWQSPDAPPQRLDYPPPNGHAPREPQLPAPSPITSRIPRSAWASLPVPSSRRARRPPNSSPRQPNS